MLNRNGRYPDDPCLRRYRLRLYARCRIALGVTPKSRAMRAVRSPVRYLLRARCFCAGDSFHVRITRSPRSHSSLAPRVAARQANSTKRAHARADAERQAFRSELAAASAKPAPAYQAQVLAASAIR